VESEPIADERLRTLIDDELKALGIPQDHSTKTIEERNSEFIKKYSNSLAQRAEGNEKEFIDVHVTRVFRVAAKVMLLLNPTNNLKAIEFLTTLDSSFIDQNLKVRLILSVSYLHRWLLL
jgi:hypothetical protein